jgi:hypothetical protein
MPRSTRRRLIDESRVGTYHCSSRCVRRSSFRDRTSGGLELDHRQEWIVRRLRAIAEFFAIDVTDFAVIDNEFHVVLRNRPDVAAQLTDEQVIRRWFRMSRQCLELQPEIGKKQLKDWLAKRKKLAEFRRRLSSISWLMIMLKEPIARAANAEDGVRGHFFGERFSSVELEDSEQQLATSLQINSLPLRAGLAKDLATSRFTAAYARRNGDGSWLAGEWNPNDSQRSATSPTATSPEADSPLAAPPSAGPSTAGSSTADFEPVDSEPADSEPADSEPVDSEMMGSELTADRGKETDGAALEVVGIDSASSPDRLDASKSSPLFHRLPLDVYMGWLESTVAPAGDKAALKTASLEIPVELPAAWLRYGLDAAKWSDAVETIAPRFQWLAEVAASMRRDCRRFVADESSPTR